MAWAEGGNADSDEKPGVIAVQISLCHDVVRDVTRLPILIKFVADLMTGGDRSLPRCEGDALGRERAQESGATARTKPATTDRSGRGERTWGVATAAGASLTREVIVASRSE
jgi:hypothetical protein